MGSRNRKDPAGHQDRGKGKPTPVADQNADVEQPQQGTPGPLIVFVPVGYTGQIAEHPRLGKLLDLAFIGPGGAQALIRLAVDHWPELRKAVDGLFEEEDTGIDNPTMTRSGIHLPGNVAPEDVEREAKATAALREEPK